MNMNKNNKKCTKGDSTNKNYFLDIDNNLFDKLGFEEYTQCDISNHNCHNGQLKLFLTEVDFLDDALNYFKEEECVLIYAGAAEGYHFPLIEKMYPKMRFIVYDPREFGYTPSKNTIQKTGKEGFFTIDTAKNMDKIIKKHFPDISKYKLFFTSDIRMKEEKDPSKDELMIFNQNKEQLEWIFNMNPEPEFVMLKLHIPYQSMLEKIGQSYDYDLQDNNKSIMLQEEQYAKLKKSGYDKFMSIGTGYKYLFGRINIQAFRGSESAETRIISKKAKYYGKIFPCIDGEKYPLIYYNAINYEKINFYYNIHIRQHQLYKENDLISEYKKYIMNLYDNYDLSMALVILYSYFTKRWTNGAAGDKGDNKGKGDKGDNKGKGDKGDTWGKGDNKGKGGKEYIISSIIDVFTWFNNLFPTKTFGICEIKKLISNKKNIYKYMKHCKNVGTNNKEINDYIDKLIADKMNNFITICNENKKLQMNNFNSFAPSIKNSIYNYNKSLEKISISNNGIVLSFSPLHKNFVVSTNKKEE